MARERIDNVHEAKQLLDKYRPTHESTARPDDSVSARPVHAVSATGMNGVEVDLSALTKAETALAGQHETLVGLMNTAVDLAGPLPDGTSPIATPMRRAFQLRSDVDGGVQRVLRDYLAEVFAVRIAIAETLRSYDALDDDSAALLRQQAADFATEVD